MSNPYAILAKFLKTSKEVSGNLVKRIRINLILHLNKRPHKAYKINVGKFDLKLAHILS